MEAESSIISKEIKSWQETFHNKAVKELNLFIDDYFRALSGIVKAFKNRYEKLSDAVLDNDNWIKYLRDYNTSLLEMLSKYQQSENSEQESELFASYFTLLDAEAKSLPAIIRSREIFHGYPYSKSDSLNKFFSKAYLNSRFVSHKAYVFVENSIKKILKKPLGKIEIYRTRKLPYRNMALFYLGVDLMPGMEDVLGELMKLKSRILLKLWEFDDSADDVLEKRLLENNAIDISDIFDEEKANLFFAEVANIISSVKADTKDNINKIVQEAFDKLDQSVLRADTPDLPSILFSPENLKIHDSRTKANLSGIYQKWINTHKTLFDDWIVDVDIVLLYYAVLSNFVDLEVTVDTFVNEKLTTNLEQLSAFFVASAKRIDANSGSAKKLSESLIRERDRINKEYIDKLLTQTVEKLTGKYTEDIEKFRLSSMKLADKVSDRRGFIKSADYLRGVRNSEIKYISPRDLLNFEAIPHFEKKIGSIRRQVDESLEKARLKIISSGTVSDFSLESALLLLEQKKKALKSVQQVATEGYERATSHLEDAAVFIKNISKEPLVDLRAAIHEFNAEIQKLKDNENILNLNLQIAKISAIERTKKARRDTVQMVKNSLPHLAAILKESFAETYGLIRDIKTRIGFTEEKKQLSYEVSEFIRQTEASLKKLPFVYQRLYQLNPTDEERFFVNRIKEIELLKSAFDDWQKERFVITAVIGEKGSGITSLLKYFLNVMDTELSVIHQSPEIKIHTPDQYFSFFEQILEQEKFSSNDDIINFLNSRDDKQIIILENLHHLFLKKVNGLQCQRMLFDLMANTVNMVFWVGSYTTHSWDYLNKSIQVSDHFVREIRLQPMDSQSLKEIIYKRNNLSGYKVRFEPAEGARDSKAFRKMTEQEQQDLLGKEFFDDLTSRSNGNVSLAQLYWLRSTHDVTEETISVGSSIEIDLSFVKDTKSEYLFALYAMLVHDGLTLADYSNVFNLSESECRNLLIPMLEKGLLIRPKSKFNINPIVFRQVVSLLRSRNFIR